MPRVGSDSYNCNIQKPEARLELEHLLRQLGLAQLLRDGHLLVLSLGRQRLQVRVGPD